MKIKGEIGNLEITILKRSNPETDDYWDGNWLESEIRINIPGFNVLYGTNLRVDDLQRFQEKLIAFKSYDIKEIEFTTMEDGLYLHFIFAAEGIIECRGKANNHNGNCLNFVIQINLISLDSFMNELKKILETYPLIGHLD